MTRIKLTQRFWREKFVDGKKMAFITDPDGYEVEILEH